MFAKGSVYHVVSTNDEPFDTENSFVFSPSVGKKNQQQRIFSLLDIRAAWYVTLKLRTKSHTYGKCVGAFNFKLSAMRHKGYINECQKKTAKLFMKLYYLGPMNMTAKINQPNSKLSNMVGKAIDSHEMKLTPVFGPYSL